MPVHLLDVNVLVALAWSNHVHHSIAHAWFTARGNERWATCPITEAGFVRVSSNPKAVQSALTVRDAIVALSQLTAHTGHVFWPDSLRLIESLASITLVGHRQITDAYLAGLAKSNGGKLATLDQAIKTICDDVEVLIG